MLGSTEPRIFTPPLRELTPDTSYGFDVIDFARDKLGEPLDPWEEWTVVHAGELLPDGRPRFRVVLILAARQNGKTLIGKTLIKYWLSVDQAPLTLVTSTDRKYAKRTWNQIVKEYKENDNIGPGFVRLTSGEEAFVVDGAELIFAANNGNAARSTTLHRWLCDELREHTDWACWASASNAMNAVPDGQIVVLTNQCDDSGVVLDSLHGAALDFIETGVGDPRLGLIEYSAPDGCDPADPAMLALANPNYGRRVDPDALIGAALRAVAAGGKELTEHKTEVLCQRVPLLNPAIHPDGWTDCLDVGDLNDLRDRVAWCVDVAPDELHATLSAAAVMPDRRVRGEVVRAWTGPQCLRELERDLPGMVGKARPRMFGWFPTGPAASVAATLKDRKLRGWPPRGVTVEEIRGEVQAVCMGFAALVKAKGFAHANDPLLNAHTKAAEKLARGDGWVFSRRGGGHCDAAYSMAGAVHLARTMPPPAPKSKIY